MVNFTAQKIKNDDTFSYACLSLSQARSSERNRATRSAPTYFRQTYGLLSNRDVRIVCSCQPSDFSAKSRHHQLGRARRSERTTRHSGAAPSISLSLRGRCEALRLRSFTLVHTYVNKYVHTYIHSYIRTMYRSYIRAKTYVCANPYKIFITMFSNISLLGPILVQEITKWPILA